MGPIGTGLLYEPVAHAGSLGDTGFKPGDDGYRVPRNRQGMGDNAWFITYWVTATPYTGP